MANIAIMRAQRPWSAQSVISGGNGGGGRAGGSAFNRDDLIENEIRAAYGAHEEWSPVQRAAVLEYYKASADWIQGRSTDDADKDKRSRLEGESRSIVAQIDKAETSLRKARERGGDDWRNAQIRAAEEKILRADARIEAARARHFDLYRSNNKPAFMISWLLKTPAYKLWRAERERVENIIYREGREEKAKARQDMKELSRYFKSPEGREAVRIAGVRAVRDAEDALAQVEKKRRGIEDELAQMRGRSNTIDSLRERLAVAERSPDLPSEVRENVLKNGPARGSPGRADWMDRQERYGEEPGLPEDVVRRGEAWREVADRVADIEAKMRRAGP